MVFTHISRSHLITGQLQISVLSLRCQISCLFLVSSLISMLLASFVLTNLHIYQDTRQRRLCLKWLMTFLVLQGLVSVLLFLHSTSLLPLTLSIMMFFVDVSRLTLVSPELLITAEVICFRSISLCYRLRRVYKSIYLFIRCTSRFRFRTFAVFCLCFPCW